jgi:serine/threonine protein kinase
MLSHGRSYWLHHQPFNCASLFYNLRILQYLLQGILHRDLKLENVLLGADRLQVAITDFGLSNSWSLGKILNTYCGSAEYAAPELFAKRNYGPEVPVY